MSLYIRTKMFQILEVTKKEKDTSFKNAYWYKCKRNRYKMNSMHSDFVIKESDNLEDLCDEFVVVSNTEPANYRRNWTLLDKAKEDYNEITCPKKELYGAIWTNTGLAYVAKLNENEELELI